MRTITNTLALISLFVATPMAAQEYPSKEEADRKQLDAITATIEEISRESRQRRDLLEASTATLPNWREANPIQADYPPSSWLAGEGGLVVYEIAVDPTGKATQCRVVETSGHSALDETTCATVMERGEFKPARNEAGEAIKGVYRGRHFWRKREPEVPGTFRFKATFTVDERGRSVDCVIEAMEGNLPFGMSESVAKQPCPFGARNNKIPYRDANGVPVAKRVTVEFSAKISDAEVSLKE